MHILADRFWKYVEKKDAASCWRWLGGIKSTGRGNFWVNGKTIQAHRMAWMLTNGDIPDGLLVCHTCDHGWCVNPSHLYLGTYSDNTQDMVSKHRHPWILRRGESIIARNLQSRT